MINSRKKIKLDWHTNSFVCHHCGARQPLDKPIDMVQLTEDFKVFRRKHLVFENRGGSDE